MLRYEAQSNQFKHFGFTLLDKPLCLDLLSRCEGQIPELKHSDQCHIYKDRNGLARRLEKFITLTDDFKELDNSCVSLLKQITGNEYRIFKDKINFKPPMGEGFHAHYDGIFKFVSSNGVTKDGWYEYSDSFVNVLILLNDFTLENGCLEIANVHRDGFQNLYQRTKMNGTPDLNAREVNLCSFSPLLANKYDVVIFDHRCPHRSAVNMSDNDRSSIYLTYNLFESGDFYDQYFNDKRDSSGKHKSLTGPSAP